MFKQTITIITPSYNCKQVFRAIFDSVTFQTYKDFEWIIAGECSTDRSFEYKEISKNDKRIKVFKITSNGGFAAARNIELKLDILYS